MRLFNLMFCLLLHSKKTVQRLVFHDARVCAHMYGLCSVGLRSHSNDFLPLVHHMHVELGKNWKRSRAHILFIFFFHSHMTFCFSQQTSPQGCNITAILSFSLALSYFMPLGAVFLTPCTKSWLTQTPLNFPLSSHISERFRRKLYSTPNNTQTNNSFPQTYILGM